MYEILILSSRTKMTSCDYGEVTEQIVKEGYGAKHGTRARYSTNILSSVKILSMSGKFDKILLSPTVLKNPACS